MKKPKPHLKFGQTADKVVLPFKIRRWEKKKMKNAMMCFVLLLVTSSVFVETLYLRDRPTRIERNINR